MIEFPNQPDFPEQHTAVAVGTVNMSQQAIRVLIECHRKSKYPDHRPRCRHSEHQTDRQPDSAAPAWPYHRRAG